MEKIISENPGGAILFLGRVTHFTPQELQRFVVQQGMRYVEQYEGEEVALLVLSSILTPVEEELSSTLYEAGVPDVTLEHFERYYSQHIKAETLLMSLKLSNDQERLKRLLGNEAFDDALFLRLFGMYRWGEEGIHENDANRDVTIAFVKRFFRPDGFRDPAMVYAPTTVMIIAKDSSDPAVLEAILSMPNHEIKTSRYEHKKPGNLREMLAFNPYIGELVIKKLLTYGDPGIDYFLASNPALSLEALERIYQRSDSPTRQMMAHNEALPDTLFERLLEEETAVQQRLLAYQPMTPQRLEKVLHHPQIISIGGNVTIGPYLPRLLALENRALDLALAANSAVGSAYLERLYRDYGESISTALASNPNLPGDMAEMFYETGSTEILEALAANPATPGEILDSLCEREDRELNRHLASNPSVDLYWLRQFQLDTSLIRILAENETYGKSILKGLGL